MPHRRLGVAAQPNPGKVLPRWSIPFKVYCGWTRRWYPRSHGWRRQKVRKSVQASTRPIF